MTYFTDEDAPYLKSYVPVPSLQPFFSVTTDSLALRTCYCNPGRLYLTGY